MYRYLFFQLPGDFRLESRIDFQNPMWKFVSCIPYLRYLIAKYLISSGRVWARVWNVDLGAPTEYKLDGWTIRNRSERQDGTYLCNNSAIILK